MKWSLSSLPIPSYLKRFNVLALFFFFIWMLFFDSNDLITQFRTYSKVKKAESEKAFYEEKIIEVEKSRKELMGSPALLEKYAREQYLMKKINEDVYLIESDPEKMVTEKP